MTWPLKIHQIDLAVAVDILDSSRHDGGQPGESARTPKPAAPGQSS
jgi:hypothetical protein